MKGKDFVNVSNTRDQASLNQVLLACQYQSDQSSDRRREAYRFTEFEFSQVECDPKLSGPPSGQGAGGGARTCDRRVPVELRADLLATVQPTLQMRREKRC
ncbi:hypothetical protein PoB_007195200 [Plakobranchus ocellatus]|uniref:Uncharacterized protein n=1 Tax=Plakobranchus ocellatus TaxID=259542 RepID=A0AAV4DMF1_9GAST|nr:hypothetical protein PoB_007195200 [Plakobranchus ocellatus]